MMKKHKLLGLMLLILIFSSALMIGCTSGNTILPYNQGEIWGDSYKGNGEDWRKVIFYFNGGLYGGSYDATYFFKEGARIPTPAARGKISNPTRRGYDFYAWYQVKKELLDYRKEYLFEKDEKDNDILTKPVLNTKGEHAYLEIPYIKGHDFTNQIKSDKNSVICPTCGIDHSLTHNDEGELSLTLNDFADAEGNINDNIFVKKWNFDFDTVEDDTCLIAIWQAKRQYVIVPPEYANDNFNAEDYDRLKFLNIGAGGEIQFDYLKTLAASMAPTLKPGFNVKDFYVDRSRRQRIIDSPNYTGSQYYPPISDGDYDEETGRFKVIPIYIDWLDAKYEQVSTANQLKNFAYELIDNVLKLNESKSYYITQDIDFNGQAISFPDNYRGSFEGNGYTISNLTITINEDTNIIGTSYNAFFKNLIGATIRDITFKNLTIKFIRVDSKRANPDFYDKVYNINMLAEKIDAKTTIANVHFGIEGDNSKFIIEESTTLTEKRQDVLVNGHRVRWGLKQKPGVVGYTDEIAYPIYYDIEKYPVTGYPEEGDIVDGIVIKYDKSELGEILHENAAVIDRNDGKKLYGYRIDSAPDYAADRLIINQLGDSFRFNSLGENLSEISSIFDLSVGNMLYCTNNIKTVGTQYDWRIVYHEGDELPELKSVSSYTFAGWYTDDFTWIDPKDVLSIADGTVLTAYWKR